MYDTNLNLYVTDLDVFNLSGSKGNSSCVGGSENTEPVEDTAEDNAPLFYCPGRRGFYSPRQGRASFERLDAFRNTGRLVITYFSNCIVHQYSEHK